MRASPTSEGNCGPRNHHRGAGWFQGLKNGELLQAAADQNFDVLISVDQNLAYQQNLRGLPIAVVIMRAKRTKYETLVPLVPQVLEALRTTRKGNLVVVEDVSA